MANPGVVQELSARAKMMSNLRTQFREQGNRDSNTTEMLEKLLGTLGDLKPTSSSGSMGKSATSEKQTNKAVDAIQGVISEFEDFKRSTDRLHTVETKESEIWNRQQERTLHKEFEDLREALKHMGGGSGGLHVPHFRLPHLRGGKRGITGPHEHERARLQAEEEHKNARRAEEKHRRQSEQAEKEENARRKQSARDEATSKRNTAREAKEATEAERKAQQEATKKIQYAKSANEADDLRKAEAVRRTETEAAAAKKAATATRLANEAKDAEKLARTTADAAKLARAGKTVELAKQTSTAAKILKTGTSAVKVGARQSMKLIPGIGLVVDAASLGTDIYTAKEHAGESFLGQKQGEGGILDSRALRYGDAALAGGGIGATAGAAIGSAFFGVGAAPGAVIGGGLGAVAGAGSVAIAEADIPNKIKAAEIYAIKGIFALHDWAVGKTSTAKLPVPPTATSAIPPPPVTPSSVARDVAAISGGVAMAGGGKGLGGSVAALAGAGAVGAAAYQPNTGPNTATNAVSDKSPVSFDKLHFDLGDLNSLTLNIASILGADNYDEGGRSGAGSGTGGGGYKGGSGTGGAEWSPNSVSVGTSGPVKDVANSVTLEAHKQGLDPGLALTTAQIESSMGTAKKNPNSTAQGVFQLTDRTWKGVGGTDINRDDISAQIQLGVKSLKSSQDAAGKALGHAPEAWQTYMLHQQGQAGGSALLNADPNANAIQTLAPVYGSEESARKAIINNGGSSDTTAQDFMNTWKNRYNTVAAKVSKAMPEQYAGNATAGAVNTASNSTAVNTASNSTAGNATVATVDNTANKVQRSDIIEKTAELNKVAANSPGKQTPSKKAPAQAPASMGMVPDLDSIPLALNDQGIGLVLTGSVN